MEKETVVRFDYPVKVKGVEVEEVTVRKPKVKDELNAAKFSNEPLEQEVWMISTLTNVPIADIKELDSDQYALILEGLGKLKAQRKNNS